MKTEDRLREMLSRNPKPKQKDMARELGISESAVSQALKKLKKSLNLSAKITSDPHIPSRSLQLRLHRFQRSYKILNAFSEEKLKSLKLNDRLNNNRQWLGTGFRITVQHLELEGLELISDSRLPVAILEALAISKADYIAQALALQYGLVIAQNGTTPPTLTEIELNATQLTDKVEKRGLIEIYSDKEGYKVWLDWSFGVGGLESNKVLYIQKLTDLANYLIEDKWSPKFQLEFNSQLQQNSKELQTLISEQNKFFIRHNELILQMTKLIKKLDKKLSQRRLFE